MKNLLKLTALICLMAIFSACTANVNDDLVTVSESENSELMDPCVGEQPKTRVINNGTVAFNLEVFAVDGTAVVTILNIPPNTTTSWATFNQAELMFSLKGSNFDTSDDKVLLQMDNCMAFEIEVDVNNEIVSYIPTVL